MAQRDLLNSDPDDPHFVAEIDNRGRAHLRFGDGELGRRPEAVIPILQRLQAEKRPISPA